jgi:hypothetical protein
MIPAATLLTLVALVLAACGGSDDDPAPAPAPTEEPGTPSEPDTAGADPADVRVIDAWSTALRDGDVNAAAAFFAIPSIAENGPTLRLESRADARLFNATLPCGAVLVGAESQGDFTTATFELTERPGPGSCGPGTGGEAQTAFVIEDGKIVEWRRVAAGGPQPAPGEAV